MAHPLALVRPVAVLAAGLLLAGAVQAAPAAADPDQPTVGLSVSVSTAGDPASGPGSAEAPLQLGRAPGAADLVIQVVNTGTEALTSLSVVTVSSTNGSITAPDCGAASSLEVGATVLCSARLSGVQDGAVHEDVTTATATGGQSGTSTSADVHLFASAVDESVTLGDRVWRDSDGDGVQDPDEPGIGGVRLSVTGPDGAPVPDALDPTSTLGTQVTADDGTYAFTRLAPLASGSYTVTVDPASAALAGLVATRAGVGSADQDSSTGSATSTSAIGPSARDLGLDFGFVPAPAPGRATVALTADASPEPAITGSTITVKGSITRDGKAFKTSAALEFSADGSDTWATVKKVRSSSKGALSATTEADGPGSFRYRFGGDATTEAGVSNADHVEVRKATVRLSVSAPGSVTKGKSIKVKGSIKREGKKYRATTTLEFRTGDDDGWSKVKTVRSSRKGALSASVKPSRSGEYRYRFAGNATTSSGVSGADHVTVKPKPPAKPKPKRYKNCTALTKVYPHGVGRSGARDKGGDVTDFTRDTETYKLNIKSDRDKDGIACER